MKIELPKTNIVSVVFSYATDATQRIAQETSKASGIGMKEYNYYLPEYLQGNVAVGDTVLVYCATGYQLAEIRRLNVYNPCKITSGCDVVAKVDLDQYFEYLKHKQQLEEMKQAIHKEKKRLESLVTYELIAEKNPAFKALLENFLAAGGSIEE